MDPTTHCTASERSTTGLHLARWLYGSFRSPRANALPLGYISLAGCMGHFVHHERTLYHWATSRSLVVWVISFTTSERSTTGLHLARWLYGSFRSLRANALPLGYISLAGCMGHFVHHERMLYHWATSRSLVVWVISFTTSERSTTGLHLARWLYGSFRSPRANALPLGYISLAGCMGHFVHYERTLYHWATSRSLVVWVISFTTSERSTTGLQLTHK